MSRNLMKACIKALIRPPKKDIEKIYNVIFLNDPVKRKTTIIDYFKSYFASDSDVLDYVAQLDAEDAEYNKMYLGYLESIRKHKPQNISDTALLYLSEKKFFESYGLAMGKCSSKKIEFDENEKVIKEDGEEELRFNSDQVRAMKLAIDKYYSKESIAIDSLAALLSPSVTIHKTKKYRVVKKYANECHLKASAIKRAYKAYKGSRDTIFNNNKHTIVDDFKAIVTHESSGDKK